LSPGPEIMNRPEILVGETVEGEYLERPNRFLVVARVWGERTQAHLPNPGRMKELLFPGVRVILRRANPISSGAKPRKTSYDAVGVIRDGQAISLDTRVPNRLIGVALSMGAIPELDGYPAIRPEFPYSGSRIDFCMESRDEICLLEVKSCTLVQGSVALFPDAFTERGRRHVNHLIQARGEGMRSCLLFMVQRTDAEKLSVNDETDPKFAEAVREAMGRGVEVYAYRSSFEPPRIVLRERMEVDI